MVNRSRAVWKKSSYSGANGCVEVAFIAGQVAVRDSKHRSKSQRGPALVFTPVEWDAFLRGVRDGEFDPPSVASR